MCGLASYHGGLLQRFGLILRYGLLFAFHRSTDSRAS
jgi:hypothetical protein